MSVDISIIVPVYNSMKYIGECIESVLLQSYKNIELLIIDDASTDKSLEIINGYAKNNSIIKVVTLKKNGKQGAARNIGIDLARGKYILFLDSDDLLDYNACELLYKEAESKDADIVFCDYLCFGRCEEQHCSHVSMSYMGILNVRKRKALLTTSVVPWAKLIKKSIITKNQLYFPEGKFYEDQATTYLYFLYANCVSKIEKDLYKYRVTTESTSNGRNQLRHMQSLEMSQLLISRMKDRGFYSTYYKEIEYFAIEQMYCMSIERLTAQFDVFPIKYANEILKTLKMEFPNFINNDYYKKFMSDRRKLLLHMHMKSDNDLLRYIQEDHSKICPNYTSNLSKYYFKLSEFETLIENRQFDLALWGAGRYGKTILKVLNEYGVEVKEIFDGNLEFVNKRYDKFYISDYRTIRAKTLIIIPFENWVSSIKSLLRKNNIKTYVFNFEVFIKHNLEDCIEKV